MAALVGGAALVLTGCPDDKDDSVTMDQRINLFINDVNADNYGNLWTHMHPDSSAYTQRRDASTWTADFPRGDRPFSITTLNISGSTVSTTITSSGSGLYSGSSITFTMQLSGKDVWAIRSISGAITVN
ncbi:MAG: hypothetical protein EA427_06100 [Spirochaetaceae bacterium]|nr:MAG: hypothetical protein EA427_06100 [Spirochaetaceae bacterium]